MIITTRFIGPTNYRGARIKATLDRPAANGNGNFSVTVAYDYQAGSGSGGAHMEAAVDVVRAWNQQAAKVHANEPGMFDAVKIISEFVYAGESHDERGYVYAAVSDWAPRFSVSEDGGTYSLSK